MCYRLGVINIFLLKLSVYFKQLVPSYEVTILAKLPF